MPYQETVHFGRWEELSAARPWLDRFCSSPYWGVPLWQAFQGHSDLYVYQNDRGLALFCEREVQGGTMLFPPDGCWLLGAPLLADDPAEFFRTLVHYWRRNPMAGGIRQILVGGIYPSHPLADVEIWRRIGGWEIEPSGRMVASLEGAWKGFMGRRSKNFRSRLRRMVKAAAAEEISIEWMPEQADEAESSTLLNRVFALEGKSWKGLSDRGIDAGTMKVFYQYMVPMLAGRGRLRGLFLRRRERDVAYLFGAFFGGYFRGLQFSYLDDLAHLGLGNVCQYHMIRKLLEEDCRSYDLGQAMDYKKRWAEQHIISRSFVFQI